MPGSKLVSRQAKVEHSCQSVGIKNGGSPSQKALSCPAAVSAVLSQQPHNQSAYAALEAIKMRLDVLIAATTLLAGVVSANGHTHKRANALSRERVIPNYYESPLHIRQDECGLGESVCGNGCMPIGGVCCSTG